MRWLCFICIAFICQSLHAQKYNLSVVIEGLKNKEGEIQIGIYNNKESFPEVDKQFKVVTLSAGKFTGTYTISDLPAGEYAIAIFHDENLDKVCNTNFLGIPKEGYGFSNNVRPKLSAPSFDDCKINLKDSASITIRMLY